MACRTVLILCFLFFSLTAIAVEPEKKAMIIRFNNIASFEYGQCAQDCRVMDIVASYFRGKAKQKESLAIHDSMKGIRPDFEPASEIVGSIKCLPLSGENETCYDVFLAQGSQALDKAFFEQIGKRGSESVSITVDVRYERKALQIDYSFAEFAVDGIQVAKQMVFTYRQKAPGDLAASPFPDKLGGKLNSAQQAAANYWLNPSMPVSPLESAFNASLSEFREVVGLLHHDLGPIGLDFTTTDIYKKLPRLAELKEEGKYKCVGNECKRPYLRQYGNRMWYFPDNTLGIAFLFSVPTR